MITQEMNERLTQTGPGTPMGKLLRRYWWPVGATSELKQEPVQPIRILGENLTLFRLPLSPTLPRQEGGSDGEGARYGLIAQRCAHRGISMAYGIPQENGLRCAYHGWTYDTEGHVIDMPFEPACLPLKITAYPVQELGGLVWAYLGPDPAPLLPRWEGLVRDDVLRSVSFRPLPCNWVQCMDNSMDPIHFEHLHGNYFDWYNRHHGIERRSRVRRHLKIGFDVFEYGIYKRRLTEGDAEDCDDWTVGHPVLFPYTLVQGPGTDFSYQMRVPMDDTHTLHLMYVGRPLKPGEAADPSVPARRESVQYDAFGRVDAPWILAQDEMAWIGQGPISDRTHEHPGTSDQGVLLYHRLLLENIERVERGEDPMGIIRDPERNYPYIQLRRERASHKVIESGYAQDDPRRDRVALVRLGS